MERLSKVGFCQKTVLCTQRHFWSVGLNEQQNQLQAFISSCTWTTQFQPNRLLAWICIWICQDPVEEYFGNQRKLGRRCDNPDFNEFSFKKNVLYIQRSVSCTSGNTKGRRDKNKTWINVVEDKFPKRKKQNTKQMYVKNNEQ